MIRMGGSRKRPGEEKGSGIDRMRKIIFTRKENVLQ